MGSTLFVEGVVNITKTMPSETLVIAMKFPNEKSETEYIFIHDLEKSPTSHALTVLLEQKKTQCSHFWNQLGETRCDHTWKQHQLTVDEHNKRSLLQSLLMNLLDTPNEDKLKAE